VFLLGIKGNRRGNLLIINYFKCEPYSIDI